MNDLERYQIVKYATVIFVIASVWGIHYGVNAVYAQELEEEIAEAVGEGLGDVIDKLTEDIDFSDENFLNTNKQETDELIESGKGVMNDLFNMFISMKDFAKSAVQWISPYEISGFLLTMIGIAFAIIFILSIMKAISKHVIILIGLGLGIVLIFVILNIQT